MSKLYLFAALAIISIATPTSCSQACESYLACDNVQQIYVGKGRRHLAGGKTEIFYAVGVFVDTTTSNLKGAFASCPGDTITIHVGKGVFALPKAAISPAGNWFGIDRSTPKEALDAAMSMCPEKVKTDLDE